jgi:hypothetical protein
MRKMYAISWRRALLFGLVPGVVTWWMVRRSPRPDDQPFNRTPRLIEVVPSIVGITVIAAGVIAGNRFLLFGGGFLCYFYATRTLVRLVAPRTFLRSERELRAFTLLTFRGHLIIQCLLVFAMLSSEWIVVAILIAILGAGDIIGALFLRLASHGFVDEQGDLLPSRLRASAGTMTTATRRPRGS